MFFFRTSDLEWASLENNNKGISYKYLFSGLNSEQLPTDCGTSTVSLVNELLDILNMLYNKEEIVPS